MILGLRIFICFQVSNHHHHHRVVLLAWISLTTLAFVSIIQRFGQVLETTSCVHRRTLLGSSSKLLRQCPACLVSLIWMVLEMDGRWPYSYCFVGCCFQDLFNMARSILVQFPSSFFSIRLVSVHVVNPYGKIDMTPAWKKCVLFYRISLISI